MKKTELIKSMFLLLLCFLSDLFLCEAQKQEWPLFHSTCGDGIVLELNEECDSVAHCTNCLCDTGYYSAGNNTCLPKCDIKGCLTGCTAPNQCGSCDTNLGFASDCHSCNFKTHYAKGFLECQTNEPTHSCIDYITAYPKELSLTNPEIKILANEHQLNVVKKTAFLYGPNPIAEGAWVKLSITEDSYYIIETSQKNSQSSISFASYQNQVSGQDTVLFITDSCVSDSSYEIITENNDVSEKVKSSRIIRSFTKGIYYIFVFTPYNKGFSFDTTVYLTKITHPCGVTSTKISISAISNGFVQKIFSAFTQETSSACTSSQSKGQWFFVEGANLNIKFDTCSSVTDYPTSIYVLQIDKKQYVDGSETDITVIDCVTDTKCLQASYTGCPNNNNLASTVIAMDNTHDYFIHVVQQSPLGSEYTISASVVCPMNCGGNGVCDIHTGTCTCKPGYTLNFGICSLCGNGVYDVGEDCDPSVSPDPLCDSSSCYCKLGYSSFSIAGKTECAPPSCGNGILDPLEECDGGKGCGSNCLCGDGYVSYTELRTYCLSKLCGNGEIDEGEDCDGGDGCYQCECQSGWYPHGAISCRKIPVWLYWVLYVLTIFILYWIFLIITGLFIGLLYRRLNKIIKSDLENLDLIESKMQVFDNQVIPFDSSNSQFIDATISNPLFSFNPCKVTFDDCGDMPDVDDPVVTLVTLTNLRDENLHFIFHGEDNEKYKLAFKPTTGIIKKNKSIDIEIHLLVKCTCVLRCKIPVTLRYGQAKDVIKDLQINNPELVENNLQNSQKSGEFENKSNPSSKNSSTVHSGVSNNLSSKKKKTNKNINKFYTFLTFEISSGLSTKLDYDEIVLQPPSIGEGTFGVVYKGTWRSVDVAVKQLKTQGVSDVDKLVTMFTREAELLEKIRCPYIVSFIGCVTNKEHLCLLTEFCPLGSLRKILKKREDLNEQVKIRICQDISKGMEYLHINDILHSDLKTDNVLMVSLNPHDSVLCKVSDFGTSRCFVESSKGLGIKDIGTPVYMAPEVHQSEQITLKSDVYSFAICMLEIWNNGSLYDEQHFPDIDSILRFVCAGKRLEIPQECPYKGLIQRCWNQIPQERPQFKEISLILDTYSHQDEFSAEGSVGSRSESPTISSFIHNSQTPVKAGVVMSKKKLSFNPNGLLGTLTKSPRENKNSPSPSLKSPSLRSPRRDFPKSAFTSSSSLIPTNVLSPQEIKVETQNAYPLCPSADIKLHKNLTSQSMQRLSASPTYNVSDLDPYEKHPLEDILNPELLPTEQQKHGKFKLYSSPSSTKIKSDTPIFNENQNSPKTPKAKKQSIITAQSIKTTTSENQTPRNGKQKEVRSKEDIIPEN
ncbi:protein kinase domain containing protein [Entamoeba histolytica]|uniref:Protein kinase domain containing protein n=5 Tax=Entamoeba histolytica TaxID=5759 RepID=C4MB68_ENTH1|nr:protein kinase domain containing protein [Entamoeba histolytica HM-1:IMSS]EAL43584.1 protein kinase domain containing protein [Entamoeba histolytica HM-1:IMSS]EMD44329.1 protein kinase domain containing protein [Entamoeba histolytica KU27]ENY65818.1 protein kinase domain containing protein [Entamoeba histolytica HM-1:IMSS-A]GAT99168.1 protein kinase domain containing protein [Entamoeba histolytica]|eukprot:XP_648970.1 protein kinase domain containing protein [Entamoeba histolytica HM-1:IMSS]